MFAASFVHALPPDWPYPGWWYNEEDPLQSLIDISKYQTEQGNDKIINQGQLYWMATKGIEELNIQLSPIGGAGFTLNDFVDSSKAADYLAPVNLGQLKFVASKFYDSLTG